MPIYWDILHTHTQTETCMFNTNLLLHIQANKLLKVYPPFVNFFEMSKETLHRCDKQYPRFHAFLKVSNHIFLCLCAANLCVSVLNVLSFVVSSVNN